ncbi:MAG: hypothetical protein ACI4JV_09490 [Ruminiclostridium sp.]
MQQEKVNRLGTEPVRKLLLKTGLPVILSMVLQAVYNIVDSAFVTNMQTGGAEPYSNKCPQNSKWRISRT